MRYRLSLQPSREARQKILVGEVFGPKSCIRNTCLCQRAVQVQHSHQTRPLPAPVSNRQDRTFMGGQSRKHMMAVLPNSFDHDERGILIDLAEYLHSALL